MKPKLCLLVSVAPEWSSIDPIREAIARLVLTALGEEHSSALSMVSFELLQNALQYGGGGVDSIQLSLVAEGDEVVISVTSAIDEGSTHMASLERRLSWLQSFPSAAAAYVAALQQVFDQPGFGTLGLARVAFEGGCVLSCEIEEPGRIAVRAVRALQAA